MVLEYLDVDLDNNDSDESDDNNKHDDDNDKHEDDSNNIRHVDNVKEIHPEMPQWKQEYMATSHKVHIRNTYILKKYIFILKKYIFISKKYILILKK